VLPTGAFRVSGARLMFGDRAIGALVAGTSLDANYAQELSDLSLAGVVITVNGSIVARTVPERVARDLVASNPSTGTRTLGNEEYAIRVLSDLAPARVYTLTSIDAAAHEPTRAALYALATIAFGGFVLAAIGSLWLARQLADPINRVSSDMATMTTARDFGRTLALTGTSRELDALTTTFNDLMRGLGAAEAETRSAYLGAIRALAAALDARDPNTAGHSERVSVLSVAIGRALELSADDLEVVRLGALLHDIGKIGVPDEVLRKPGALTASEYDTIKQHTVLGARILRNVPFLSRHVAIVELHHERPDGNGYPHGLMGDDIPLAARIVHVADAYDAMTNARAYRPGRPSSDALRELWNAAGTEFHAEIVHALATALPAAASDTTDPALEVCVA
jgi:putative nucleotidyltransferase with HDIG domain